MFVVLSLTASNCAQRFHCDVCCFPYDSVNDYPCSQRQGERESFPHDLGITQSLFPSLSKIRTRIQQPFCISFLYQFPCHHEFPLLEYCLRGNLYCAAFFTASFFPPKPLIFTLKLKTTYQLTPDKIKLFLISFNYWSSFLVQEDPLKIQLRKKLLIVHSTDNIHTVC